ncbi:mucin-2-like [Eupeodes corollae]|uniref:mucin-2-like n=1 Tax=Eupeodes corollae TaxID=290404 RepID=UPI00249025AA|nr:mucin-2-like [Eupeodes corollae]
MLSLAWLTVFIIFVYVPGSTLNVIESSSSLLLLSKSDSETTTKLDKSSVALVGSSLMPGDDDDDYAKGKLILRTNNNNKTGEVIELSDITAVSAAITGNTTIAAKYQQQESFKQEEQAEVSDNAHSVITKDPSPSSPSSLLLSSSPSLLNIELTQATTSTTNTPTLTPTPTSTTTTSAIIQRTTTTKAATTTTIKTKATTETAIRTWNNLNDYGNSKNNNGRRSNSIYEQHQQTPQPPPLPPPSAQQQNRQHLQLALFSETQSSPSSLSSSLSPQHESRNTATVLPLQLTQAIQNTASVIIRGNSLNWGYVELASSDSPPYSISTLSRTEMPAITAATRLPLRAAVSQPSSTSSAASFVLSLSPGSSSFLSSSELPLMSSSYSSSSPPMPLSPTTSTLSASMSSLSTTSTARTTTSTTTPKSPSLSSSDGYLNITSQAGTHAYLPCNILNNFFECKRQFLSDLVLASGAMGNNAAADKLNNSS